MRKALSALAGIALLAATMTAAKPAVASTTGSTTAMFVFASGPLSITVPATVSLSAVAPGGNLSSGSMGMVAVSDLRGGPAGSWTATVSSTNFTTGTGTATQTIAASNVIYTPGSASFTSGTGTFTPGTQAALGSPITAFSATAEVGVTVVDWFPFISVHIPTGVVTGTYSATITHSVA